MKPSLSSLPSPHLLVFDSGVGALSIIAELRRQLPHCSITYASDNAYFPYGTKPEAELVERVDQVLTQLVERVSPDIVVVACNTASTVALPKIRSHFVVPVVGVVPAIKPAAQLSRNKVIGLLATPATVARPYTLELIAEFASDCRVISVGSSELVELAEQKLSGAHIQPAQLVKLLKPFKSPEDTPLVDTIVLGCTHFPLLKQELNDAMGATINWVDSGDAIARRVKSILTGGHVSEHSPEYQSCFTAPKAGLKGFAARLREYLPGEAHILNL